MSDDNYRFPAGYLTQGTALLSVPIAFIPFFRRFFSQMQERAIYASREDWWRCYQVFAEMEEELMSGALQQLIEGQARLYRLLDTSLNGTTYVQDPDTLAITPAIPAVPPASTSAPNALRAHVGRLWHLAENAVSGTTAPADAGITGAPALTDDLSTRATIRALQGLINAGWFGIGGQNATIADIVNALRIGQSSQSASLWQRLQEILSAGSNVASIAGFLQDLLADTTAAVTEGGLQAIQIAATLSNTAVLSALQQQQTNILAALQFDENKTKGDWDGKLGQMMFDSLVLRYQSNDTTLRGPLAYLIADQWGGPTNNPPAVTTLRMIYDLLNTPGANYSEALNDIRNYLYDATSGNGVASLVVQLTDIIYAATQTTTGASGAQAAQLGAILDVLRDLHDCVCDDGVAGPCELPETDPDTLAWTPTTRTPLQWIDISTAPGYALYLVPVAEAVPGSQAGETTGIELGGPKWFRVRADFASGAPDDYYISIFLDDEPYETLSAANATSSTFFAPAPTRALRIKLSPQTVGDEGLSATELAAVRVWVDKCAGLAGGETPGDTYPPDPGGCLSSYTEVWRIADWVVLSDGRISGPITVLQSAGLLESQAMDGNGGRLRFTVTADVDYCFTWAGPPYYAGYGGRGFSPGVSVGNSGPATGVWRDTNPDGSQFYVQFDMDVGEGATPEQYAAYVHLKPKVS